MVISGHPSHAVDKKFVAAGEINQEEALARFTGYVNIGMVPNLLDHRIVGFVDIRKDLAPLTPL
jgi:hypothetical protein